jgi:chitin synthase
MAVGRRPASRVIETYESDQYHYDQDRSLRHATMPPAEPHIARYSLTDGTITHLRTESATSDGGQYDEISQAVDQLLNNHSSVAGLQRVDGRPTSRGDQQALEHSKHRSSSSGATYVDHNEYYHGDGGEYELLKGNEDYYGVEDISYDQNHAYRGEAPHPEQPSSADYQAYQPGQLLPTINTGEPLQWEDYGQPLPSNFAQDPFVDAAAPLAMHEHVYIPPDYAQSHSRPPSRTGTALSYYPRFDLPPSEVPYQSHEPIEVGIPHAGADTFVDHFQHDTEAYASGKHSRASFHPHRSRSPTPAADDEDYHVVGSDSYAGHPPYPEPENTHAMDLGESRMMQDAGPHHLYPHEQEIHFMDDAEKIAAASMHISKPNTPAEETRHFGPAPTGRVLRRHKTKKRVQLTNGNLVVDIDVPPKLVLPRHEPEMLKTRYTAVTCDPDEFEAKGFFLRQNENRRRTELFIVITMYNVGGINFLQSRPCTF